MTAIEFRLPDVGEGIARAEIIEWRVEVGDRIDADATIAVVETDKSQVELPAPVGGIVSSRFGQPGDIVPVGEVLVVIGDAPGDAVEPAPAAATPSGRHGRVLASPFVRRVAVERGIDLATVPGTGPHGRVQLSDLDVAARTGEREVRDGVGGPPAAVDRPPVGDRRVPLRGLRRSIARSMTAALQIPHIHEFRELDATKLLAARDAWRARAERQGLPLSVLPILLRAVTRALGEVPSMNATFDAAAEEVIQHTAVDLGVATATQEGLIVPVIRNAERLGVVELARETQSLAAQARDRSATAEQLRSGTFTVTNFGSFGAWLGTPIIRPPEVGIAGFGRITDKVVVVEGRPAVRPVLPVVVAADHRVNDGADLGRFVTTLADAICEPVLLA